MKLPLLQPPVRAVLDPTGRTIRYLRLSLTKACQLRCLYCRPEFDRNVAREEMTAGELEALTRHLALRHGVRKVRLTGGDPTARKDLVDIVSRIAAVEGVDDLALTTHGMTLEANAEKYASAGLSRVNVSLDSLHAETFAALTGADVLPQVLAGVRRARDVFGPHGVKINSVVIRGQNDSHLAELLTFAADTGVEIRFIELMPMGPLVSKWAERFVPEGEMREQMAGVVERWTALPETQASARRHIATLRDGREVVVGFITPMSCNFCARCDRLRLTSDGAIYPCLMDAPRGNLLNAIRPALDGDMVDRLLAEAYAGKAVEHPHDGVVTMTHIGG